MESAQNRERYLTKDVTEQEYASDSDDFEDETLGDSKTKVEPNLLPRNRHFQGRSEVFLDVEDVLRSPDRIKTRDVVVFHGPAGCGKSSMLTETGWREHTLERKLWEGYVYYADVNGLDMAGDIARAITIAMGGVATADGGLRACMRDIPSDQAMLLLLDNVGLNTEISTVLRQLYRHKSVRVLLSCTAVIDIGRVAETFPIPLGAFTSPELRQLLPQLAPDANVGFAEEIASMLNNALPQHVAMIGAIVNEANTTELQNELKSKLVKGGVAACSLMIIRKDSELLNALNRLAATFPEPAMTFDEETAGHLLGDVAPASNTGPEARVTAFNRGATLLRRLLRLKVIERPSAGRYRIALAVASELREHEPSANATAKPVRLRHTVHYLDKMSKVKRLLSQQEETTALRIFDRDKANFDAAMMDSTLLNSRSEDGSFPCLDRHLSLTEDGSYHMHHLMMERYSNQEILDYFAKLNNAIVSRDMQLKSAGSAGTPSAPHPNRGVPSPRTPRKSRANDVDRAFTPSALGLPSPRIVSQTHMRFYLMVKERFEQEKRVYGPDTETCADLLHKMAGLLALQQNKNGALNAYRQCISIRRKVLGASHVKVAETLASLGELELAAGNLSDAKSHFAAAIAVFSKHRGSEAQIAQMRKSKNLCCKLIVWAVVRVIWALSRWYPRWHNSQH
jgi:hypothetical protein